MSTRNPDSKLLNDVDSYQNPRPYPIPDPANISTTGVYIGACKPVPRNGPVAVHQAASKGESRDIDRDISFGGPFNEQPITLETNALAAVCVHHVATRV
jgi:hypothetical protein